MSPYLHHARIAQLREALFERAKCQRLSAQMQIDMDRRFLRSLRMTAAQLAAYDSRVLSVDRGLDRRRK